MQEGDRAVRGREEETVRFHLMLVLTSTRNASAAFENTFRYASLEFIRTGLGVCIWVPSADRWFLRGNEIVERLMKKQETRGLVLNAVSGQGR